MNSESYPQSGTTLDRQLLSLRDPAAMPEGLKAPVVAIGNFDGVHLGHKRVIGLATAMAASLGRPTAVMTFDPHPRDFFRPYLHRFKLTPPEAQAGLIAALGVKALITLTFDERLAALSAEAFVDDILVGRLGVSGVVAGADFHYGQGRTGTPQSLKEAGRQRGFGVEIAEQVAAGDDAVSSTRIREALAQGEVAAANAMLGHAWFVRGLVIHGQKLGRTLGFPTANLALEPGCGLKHGIYAVWAGVDGRRYAGVASFGRRPTFDNGPPLLETFLFDFSGDLYGRVMDVAFVAFLRAEMKFDDVGSLVAQMEKDGTEARRVLAVQKK